MQYVTDARSVGPITQDSGSRCVGKVISGVCDFVCVSACLSAL